MMPSNTAAQQAQKPLYIGWKHGRKAIYTMQRVGKETWDVYRDGVLIERNLPTLAALNCAQADEQDERR